MAKEDAGTELRQFDVVRRPVVTEKSTLVSEHGQVVFEVDRAATKPQIRASVEALFHVKVLSVNTLVAKGKRKRWRGRPYQRKDVKRAIVTLADGQTIDVTTGI